MHMVKKESVCLILRRRKGRAPKKYTQSSSQNFQKTKRAVLRAHMHAGQFMAQPTLTTTSESLGNSLQVNVTKLIDFSCLRFMDL